MENQKFELGPIQEKWLQSLEQNPDRQMKHYLGLRGLDGNYKACCRWTDDYMKDGPSASCLFESYAKLGLRSKTGAGISVSFEDLAVLNDTGKTWPEIAAIVRANPEEYFTKSY
jgi:hypothetical protein